MPRCRITNNQFPNPKQFSKTRTLVIGYWLFPPKAGWCRGRESDSRHEALQAPALPLSYPGAPTSNNQVSISITKDEGYCYRSCFCLAWLLEAISKIIFGRFWYILAVKSSDFVAIAPLCLLNLHFFRSTYPQNRLKVIFEIASSKYE